MLGPEGDVIHLFSPVSTVIITRPAMMDFGEISSLTTSDLPSGVQAITPAKLAGDRVSATFLSSPPNGDVRQISLPFLMYAMYRPSGDQVGAFSRTGVSVS